MASPAWFAGFLAAFAPSDRYLHLFSLSDHELQSRGYDRAGLQRSFITGFDGR
ncbi:MAG: hypothetical protein HKN98_09040 [Silicimonas sp.]|nr:hypothetical protein [Silicimonas sp.]NNF92100.1 hypothetical protein [Boseongicola sp.]NND18711.1 hypothetical protein [Silicimonas sp.]NND22824.1 hypothetical protein [Silicimonas sp.]NND42257.1 hypothetical protein [Silicimonas sp.]